MSRFQPQPGMYFYAAVKPHTRDVEDFMGNVTQVVHRDGSYRGDVFYCMATDDTVLVCERVYGGYGVEPMVFVREDYEFTPIGPTVLAALRPHFNHKVSTPVEDTQDEFYEDNLATQNSYLREWFENSLRKTTS